ncbi:hypothetical protein KM918_28595 [Priestia megaterium]|uniref:hypothetical protein n=1 Tax=Priestia megaterium TaxID=1404 RepID=UPI001C231212|nr:hypothetical protein [Priestia megaterium]MBU8691241.1 hypothetical protein [Priestia megaterium]
MDRLDEIALSRIATILDRQRIIYTNSNSIWEKILSNAGQSELYSRFSGSLNPYSYNGPWQNPNNGFDEFYSAIKNILQIVYANGENLDEFTLLMTSMVEEINLENIFDESVLRKFTNYFDFSINEHLNSMSNDECIKFIKEESKQDFKLLINNLNVLNLDFTYSQGHLNLVPFTEQSTQISRKSSLLVSWLNKNFPLIAEMYQEAIENYIDGEPVSCISNCRNIITGLFSEYKEDGNKSWVKGLQKLSTDTNIENVQVPNNIMQGSANKNISFESDKEFKYSRFKLFYQLYSLTSDLGPHITEAPKVGGKLYPEKATQNDALLCIRMTEDILIWVIERLKSYE